MHPEGQQPPALPTGFPAAAGWDHPHVPWSRPLGPLRTAGGGARRRRALPLARAGGGAGSDSSAALLGCHSAAARGHGQDGGSCCVGAETA